MLRSTMGMGTLGSPPVSSLGHHQSRAEPWHQECAKTVTQEFHLSVTPVGNDEYLVRTEKVAPGVPLAEEQLVWTVDEWLAQARSLMSDPLLGLLQGHGVARIGGYEIPRSYLGDDLDPDSVPPSTLVELGQRFYQALFQGTLRDSWMTAQGIAQHRGEMLRLRLGLKGNKLPRLPWEVLNAGEKEGIQSLRRPIATGTDTVFSRYQPGITLLEGRSPAVIEPGQPVRILMVIAAPTDQERLELHNEAIHLQEELNHPAGLATRSASTLHPNLQLTILEQPGRAELTQALEQGRFHILHYAGHSNLDVAGGALYLVNQRTGLTETLSGDDLAGLLVNNGIRMAVFNSCRGAHTAAMSEHQEERNLAEALVKRGIPAVLAMAERIPDNVALTLTRLFYRNLKQGYPIDLSLSRARQGLISAYGSDQLYWALPILYLHPECDGFLRPAQGVAPPGGTRPIGLAASVVAPSLPPPTLAGEMPSYHLLADAGLETDVDLAIIHRAVLEEADGPDWSPSAGEEITWERLVEASTPFTHAGAGHRGQADAHTTLPPSNGGSEDLSADDQAGAIADLLKELAPSSSVTIADLDPDQARLLHQPPSAQPVPQETRALAGLANQSSDFAVAPLVSSRAGMPPQPDTPSVQPPTSVAGSTPETPIPQIPVAQAAVPQPTAAPPAANGFNGRYLLLPLLGAGIMAIAIVLAQWLPTLNRPSAPSNGSPAVQTVTAVPQNWQHIDINTASDDTLVGTATLLIQQNKLDDASQFIEALLNRNSLKAAETALGAVTADQVMNPVFNFLRGRMAWQFRQQGNTDYSLDGVQRDWQWALRGEPGSVQYRNALGFAYLEDNRPIDAIREWCTVISRSIPLSGGESLIPPGVATGGLNCPLPKSVVTDPNLLTAYAGIALALNQAALDPQFRNRPELPQQAIALYRVVMLSDPTNFEINALQQNWLWTKTAIQRWQALGSLNPNALP